MNFSELRRRLAGSFLFVHRNLTQTLALRTYSRDGESTMNVEADKFRQSSQLGTSGTKIRGADLLFAAAVIVIASAWIALVALRFYLRF